MSSSATAAVDASSPKPAANTPRRRKAICSSALEELVAPRDRVVEAALAGADRWIVAAQERRLPAQPGEDLGGSEHVAAGGRQLDREWEAVEEPAELYHRRPQRVVGCVRETRSITEQLHGRIVRGERRERQIRSPRRPSGSRLVATT